MDPEQYYDEFGEGEWERLDQDPVARLEYDNTVSELDAHLLRDGRVLDAGGGPGRYTIWLAERGYEVEHVDLSVEQVRIARAKAEDHDVDGRVTCRKGDVRDLSFDDDQFDAVCCLGGPLSHVVDEAERAAAASELRRVGKSGSPVFVSVMGRLAAVQFGIRHGLDEQAEILPTVAEHGAYTEGLLDTVEAEGWAACHSFRASEFRSLLESVGFSVERLVGLEGLASGMQSELEDASEETLTAVREVVQRLQDDRSVADVSEHMLAVCRV